MIGQQPRTWLGASCVILIASGFIAVNGVFGFLISATIALGWYMLPSMYAFAIGQFALLTITPANTAILGLLEASVVGILLEPALHHEKSLRVLVLTGGAISFVASIVQVTLGWLDPLWKTVVLFALGFAVVAYGLHRYERLTVGSLDETL